MKIETYNHAHNEVKEITWSILGELLISLALKIKKKWKPDAVVGIAKGGVIPAVFISSAFRVDFFPIKLSSRQNEEIVRNNPAWFVYPDKYVENKKVLLIDDIAVSGKTLKLASEEIKKKGSGEVRTAALITHSDSFCPDFVGLTSDALIIFPWDKKNLDENGNWILNPEYQNEMKKIPGYENI